MMSVFVFTVTWLLKAKPRKRSRCYSVTCYDIFGRESKIDGLRAEFKTHDVA
ncbi:MAG: hypothetical protein ACREAE_06320 [Nitrosopumilaceae archaeon]